MEQQRRMKVREIGNDSCGQRRMFSLVHTYLFAKPPSDSAVLINGRDVNGESGDENG